MDIMCPPRALRNFSDIMCGLHALWNFSDWFMYASMFLYVVGSKCVKILNQSHTVKNKTDTNISSKYMSMTHTHLNPSTGGGQPDKNKRPFHRPTHSPADGILGPWLSKDMTNVQHCSSHHRHCHSFYMQDKPLTTARVHNGLSLRF